MQISRSAFHLFGSVGFDFYLTVNKRINIAASAGGKYFYLFAGYLAPKPPSGSGAATTPSNFVSGVTSCIGVKSFIPSAIKTPVK
jgi:hypothetical protein